MQYGKILAISLVLAVISFGLLVYFGITLVHPYRQTYGYSPAMCSSVNVTDHGSWVCVCGGGDEDDECYSEFPCVEITVLISPTGSSKRYRKRLYKSYTPDYYKEKQRCSLRSCSYDKYRNKEEVDRFVEAYGNLKSSATYPCLVNPNKPVQAILEKPNRIAVIMAMLLPSLVIFVCLCLFLADFCKVKYDNYRECSRY